MVKIYTRTGDQGQTSLLNGTRVEKNNILIEAYGLLDELNSSLGLVSTMLEKPFLHEKNVIIQIQKNIFQMSSYISCPENDRKKFNIKNIDLNQSEALESEIDNLDNSLEKLSNFIIPGGSELSCHIHISRTKCRSSERFLISTNELESIKYLNRLSDYLFTLSRYINFKKNIQETIWP